MKYTDYDPPFHIQFQHIPDNTYKSMAEKMDDMVYREIVNVGCTIDKDKLVAALEQDQERYRQAYREGYETGYSDREDKIVICGQCAYGWSREDTPTFILCNHPFRSVERHPADWYCADAEKKEEEIDEDEDL